MGIVRTYAVHAIEDDDPGLAPPRSEGRRGFDYAELVKRGRIGMRNSPSDARRHVETRGRPETEAVDERFQRSNSLSESTHSGAECPLNETPGESPHTSSTGDSVSAQPGDRSLSAQSPLPVDPLTQRLQRLDAPYLDALASQQQTLVLADYLASRVADFCTDPAVLAQGHWTMRLTLDPAILPDCALSLTLSYFDLTLRFDTNDASSRQLVLHHADVLRRRLESLLARHDAPRTVEILTP
ncbi:MAG TPA: type III secretion system protein SctP [Trinickia sp.]|jgi:type III secretion control protein HpaP|nr:type III secretion system protein SctP [Trinickia sp.]